MTIRQIPLTTIVQFVDPKTGYLTNEGRTIINALIDRTGGATGGVILFAGDEVYGVVTGTRSRTAIDVSPALPIGVVYSAAEVQALKNYLLFLGEHVAALIDDLKGVGAIQP